MRLSDAEIKEALLLGLKAYNDISSLSAIPDEFEDFDESKARLREIARSAGMTMEDIRRA